METITRHERHIIYFKSYIVTYFILCYFFDGFPCNIIPFLRLSIVIDSECLESKTENSSRNQWFTNINKCVKMFLFKTSAAAIINDERCVDINFLFYFICITLMWFIQWRLFLNIIYIIISCRCFSVIQNITKGGFLFFFFFFFKNTIPKSMNILLYYSKVVNVFILEHFFLHCTKAILLNRSMKCVLHN